MSHHHDHIHHNQSSQGSKEGVEQNENILVPTPSHFEKLYLAPEQAVAGKLRFTFGNPTPIALAGFLMANTPASIGLMGWHGAGAGSGNVADGIASYFFFGGVLLYFGGLGEWILGNTFPATVFFTFGAFWSTFGGTLQPFFAAITSYGNTPAGFYDSFAFFLIFMGVLCFLYMIAALRTNVCLVIILLCFVIIFPLLAASYFYAAAGLVAHSNTCRIAGGAFAFISSMVGWYLWFTMIMEAVDMPVTLPVGDLSHFIKGKSERIRDAV